GYWDAGFSYDVNEGRIHSQRGQIYDASKIEETRRALIESCLFSTVRMTPSHTERLGDNSENAVRSRAFSRAWHFAEMKGRDQPLLVIETARNGHEDQLYCAFRPSARKRIPSGAGLRSSPTPVAALHSSSDPGHTGR